MAVPTVVTLEPHDAPTSALPRAGGRISQLKLQLGVASDSVSTGPPPPVLRECTNSSRSGGSFEEDATKGSRSKEPTNIHLSHAARGESTGGGVQSTPNPGSVPIPVSSTTKPTPTPTQFRTKRAYNVRIARERRYMRAERALACTLRHCPDAVSLSVEDDSDTEYTERANELRRVRALEHALALLTTHAEVAKMRIHELRACLTDRNVEPAERSVLLKERWAVEKRGREIDMQIQRVLAEANKCRGKDRGSSTRTATGMQVRNENIANETSPSPRVKPKPELKSPSCASRTQRPIENACPPAPSSLVSFPLPPSEPVELSASASAAGLEVSRRGPESVRNENPEHRRIANLAAFFARSPTHAPLHSRSPACPVHNSCTSSSTTSNTDTDTLTTQWDAYIHSTYTLTTHDPRTAFLPRRISASNVSPIRLRPSSLPSPFNRARLFASPQRPARGPSSVLNRPASFHTHTRSLRQTQAQRRLALTPSPLIIPDSQSMTMSPNAPQAQAISKGRVRGQTSMPLLSVNTNLQAQGGGNPLPPRPERSPRRMSSAQLSLALTDSSAASASISTPTSSFAPASVPTQSTLATFRRDLWDVNATTTATAGSAKIYASTRARSAAELLATTDLGEVRIPAYALSLLDAFEGLPSDVSNVSLGEVAAPTAMAGAPRQRPRRSSASYVRVNAPRPSDVVDGILAANGTGPHPTFCIPGTPFSTGSSSQPASSAAGPGKGLRKRLSQLQLRPKRANQNPASTGEKGGNATGNGGNNRHSLLLYMRKRMGSDGEESAEETITIAGTAPPTPVSDPDVQETGATAATEDKAKDAEREREKKERMKESPFTRPLRRRFGAFWGSLW